MLTSAFTFTFRRSLLASLVLGAALAAFSACDVDPDAGATDVEDVASATAAVEPLVKIGWIGLPESSCPAGGNVGFLIDDENTGNITQARVKTGWQWTGDFWSAFTTPYTRPRGLYPFGIGTRLDVCAQKVSRLPTLRGDYAVLRLAATCPAGSYPFRRHSDNEDTNDQNSNSGAAWVGPSAQTRTPTHGWTDMEFCFVPGDGNPGNTTAPPWRALAAGAFTNAWVEFPGCNEFHWVLQDDENNANQNGYDFPPETAPFETRITSIVGGVANTEYIWNSCP
jgi:hypothetical protein